MNLKLSNNIRKFRKERLLTQEQLAEALGVTVGAVYKWESGRSTPEISVLMEMADLFGVSVDSLLGYEIRSNTLTDIVERIYTLQRNKQYEEAVTEAEKALRKYPNDFRVVYRCGDLFQKKGLETHDFKVLERAVFFLKQSILLLYQNTDNEISEASIQTEIAQCYLCMGKHEEAIHLLKKYNICGVHNSIIGLNYSTPPLQQPEEAVTYLTRSFLMKELIDTISGTGNAIPLGVLVFDAAGVIVMIVVIEMVSYLAKPRFMEKAMLQYKNYVFQKLSKKSIASFQDEASAAYISALSNDSNSIELNYLDPQFQLISKTVMFFGAFGLMITYSPILTLAAIAFSVLPVIASMLAGNRLEIAERQVSDKNESFVATLTDSLSGFSVIKSFQAEKAMYDLFVQSNHAAEKAKCRKRKISTIIGAIGAVTGVTAQLGVFIVGAYLALAGKGVTGGVVIAFVNLMNFIIQPIAEVPGILANRKASMALIDKLADSLDSNVRSYACEYGQILPNKGTHHIRITDLSFGYKKNQKILHDLNFDFCYSRKTSAGACCNGNCRCHQYGAGWASGCGLFAGP